MTTKTVIQLDHNGYFIGTTIADESPLEPGVFLLPGNCVDAEFPEVIEGFLARYVDGAFVMEAIPEPEPEPVPEPTIPTVVTMRQARLALLETGILANVQIAIDSLSEPTKTAATIEWEYSQEVHRDKELVVLLAASLGLTNNDLDALFTLAATK